MCGTFLVQATLETAQGQMDGRFLFKFNLLEVASKMSPWVASRVAGG